MRLIGHILGAILFLSSIVLVGSRNNLGAVIDDYKPEVTARVARISFIRGDVKIKRSGEGFDWERATLNLPLVEGDEIATDKNARIEIQFDADSYLRLAESSYLKLTMLRDEGIALSLPQGTLSLRFFRFDKSRSFFEIDAPGTTLSVEKAGVFRVDAGEANSSEIRVTVTEGGEAQIFSQTSGFRLRAGRSAKLFLSGNTAGEWETSDASQFADEFHNWTLERDTVIARRLQKAEFDKFYDRNIYGAEELNEYGEWIYTQNYGWVWKPYRSSVSGYPNWSPYRFGHWRWIPIYGWTWVNDEPWGWATFHYGRWIWDNGYWVWTPYSYYRWRRSWWRPALVAVVKWNGSVCWYPLSYYDVYYDYNAYYYRRYVRIYNNTTIINNNTTVIINPIPTPTPSPTPVPNPLPNQQNIDRWIRLQTPTMQRIPLEAVVSVNEKDFGKQTKGYTTPPLATAKTILAKAPGEIQTPPILPEYREIKEKISREIKVDAPAATQGLQIKTGATERKPGVSMGEELRREEVFGNRSPVQPVIKRENQIAEPVNETKNSPRPTGAVNRPETKRDNTPQIPAPTYNPDTKRNPDEQSENTTRERKPTFRPAPRVENQTPPVYVPPQPSPRREEQKPREQPKPQPQPKSEPKSQPQPESKPAPKVEQDKSEKDGMR